MRRKSVLPLALLSVSLCIVFVLAGSGCYAPGGPIPRAPGPSAAKAWTNEQVDEMVQADEKTINSPVSRVNGTPPAECDNIHFMRYHLRGSDADPATADAILVLIPGLEGGENSFEYLGPQMVYMAKTQKNINLEVWGTNRRSNDLEDQTGLNAAEAAHDTQVAIDYYWKGAEINGKKFAGFVKDSDVPYMSEFGLQLQDEDVYKIITTMVPDQAVRRRKLFVGGHSLGGQLTYFFAGWDFDGNPATTDDAGYNNCAGLVALDSMILPGMPTNPTTTASTMQAVKDALPDKLKSQVPASLGPDEDFYSKMIAGMRNGTVPRILPVPVISPDQMVLAELEGMEADWHPDEQSTLLQRIPYDLNIETELKFIHSRDVTNFYAWVPSIYNFRYTNAALLVATMDDNSMPISALQASFGFLNGGAVVRKDFPLPGGLAEMPLISDISGGFLSRAKLWIANDAGPSYDKLGTGPLYGWTNFDQVGTASNPDYTSQDGSLKYTDATNEVTDIKDFAQMLYKGPMTIDEWYFSMRIMIDLGQAQGSFGPRYGLNFMYGDKIASLPKIEFLAEKGPSNSNLQLIPAGTGAKIAGYSHLDVLSAAANCPDRRANEVFGRLIDFLKATSH